MFQFPGFALNPLWIQEFSTCLNPLVSPHGDNRRLSGGFPHSETHGSKPIPGSPWLVAGYHVLHRLLLPRHPPNALFALDLIQKEQDRLRSPSFRSKACILTLMTTSWVVTVSVLDLETISP